MNTPFTDKNLLYTFNNNNVRFGSNYVKDEWMLHGKN